MANIIAPAYAWVSHRRISRAQMLAIVEVEPGIYEFAKTGSEDAVVVEAETGVYEVSSAPGAVKAANVMLLGTAGHIIS